MPVNKRARLQPYVCRIKHNKVMRALLVFAALLLLASSPILAQDATPNPANLFDAQPAELSAFAESGFGTEQNNGAKFFSLGVHAGKVLTPAIGPGMLRGQFEIGAEVIPFWQAYIPRYGCGSPCVPSPNVGGGTFTGISIVPANFRWDFTHGKKFVPWLQGAGGLIYTTHKFPSPPADTSVWNFSPQFGIGTHYFLRQHRSLDFSANAVHISSASLGDKNPGINASVMFAVGYTWWK